MSGPARARRRLRGLAVLAIVAVACASDAASAEAATFTVNSTADAALDGSVTCAASGATCTLRAAIQAADAAGGASTITLPAGSYALAIAPPPGAAGSDADDPATGDLDVDHQANVTLVGSGAASTLINAKGLDRAFAVHTGASLTISDLTVEGGSPALQSVGSQYGGAIYSDGGLTTKDVNFTANASSNGGAIYADSNSRLSVDGGIFTGNGTQYGGAIEDVSANPAGIQGAVFTEQTANYGGGDLYYTGSGALTVADSSFTDTSGYDGGGAIYSTGSGALSVSRSQFTDDNSYYGGAIYSFTPIVLSQDTFTDDTASYLGDGGALYLEGTGSTVETLNQDQFSDDNSGNAGGAIYTSGGVLEMAQSSIVGAESPQGGAVFLGSDAASFVDDTVTQSSAVDGGGLYIGSSQPLSLVNDTIAGNTASAPGGGGGIWGAASATAGSGDGVVNTVIADNTGGDCSALFASSVITGYDLDSDRTCFGGSAAPGLQIGVQPSLSPAAGNGGPVLTMLENADSSTIGTGDAAFCPAADARGIARQGAACDLGAYQAVSAGLTASNAAPPGADVNSPFEITLTATNVGPGAASNVTITDPLPAGARLAVGQPSAGSCTSTGSPTKLACDVGTLPAGKSATLTLFVSASTAGMFTNTATVSDDQGSTQTAAMQTSIIATNARPTVARGAVKQITQTAATLRARLDPHSNSVSYFYEYGLTRQFGKVTAVRITRLSGIRAARVIGLEAGHRYYFRLIATSGGNVTYGQTYSFATKLGNHHRPGKKKKQKKRTSKPATS